MSPYDASFRIMLLSDPEVDKSCMLPGFFQQDPDLSIGIDFWVKTLNIDKKKIKLQIWDLGGEERLRFLLPTYVRGADGALFIYDVTNYASIDNIDDWLSIIRKEDRAEIPILLVGILSNEKNKRQVSAEKGKEIAKSKNLNGYIECSVKTGDNIEKTFEVLSRLVLADRIKKRPIKDLLKSEECYVIVSEEHRKVYLWRGVNSNVRSRFIGAKRSQEICRQLGEQFRVIPLNEGEEDPDFVKLTVGKTQGGEAKENINITRIDFPEENASFNLLIDNLIANIQKNPSKEKLYWRLFYERFRDKNTINQSFKDEESKKKSDYDDDNDDRFPYPYIFKPPKPPDDFAMTPQLLIRPSLKKKGIEEEIHCQYCGIKLTEEEEITHSCKKKPKNV